MNTKTPNALQRFLSRFQTPVTVPVPPLRDEADPAEIEKQLKRLSKELYKWNTLAETQTAGHQQSFERALSHARDSLAVLTQEREALATRERLSLIKALFPVIDSIEAGIASGRAQLRGLQLSTPDAAEVLSGWLAGQRLLLDRLIALLEADGVKTIPSVGETFDPYLHVVLKTATDPTRPLGLILSEERRGYRWNAEVLRYAEVVVNKAADPLPDALPEPLEIQSFNQEVTP